MPPHCKVPPLCCQACGIDLKNCYEAWIPEPALDRSDLKGVVRMSEEDGITVRVMTGRTALGRRLAMAGGVDMVVTISGRQHTEVVVEQALELGLPVLPVPTAGGDSRDLLVKYRQRIAAAFDPGALDACLATVSKTIDIRPDVAATAVVDLIRTARVGRGASCSCRMTRSTTNCTRQPSSRQSRGT